MIFSSSLLFKPFFLSFIILKEIKKRKNSIFLVDKSELSPIKQSDKQALNYVIDNGKKIGNIDFFDIYVFDEEK